MGDTVSPGSLLQTTAPSSLVRINSDISDKIVYVTGNPSGLLVVNVGSQIAYDPSAKKIFMGKAPNDQIWVQLGSRQFT